MLVVAGYDLEGDSAEMAFVGLYEQKRFSRQVRPNRSAEKRISLTNRDSSVESPCIIGCLPTDSDGINKSNPIPCMIRTVFMTGKNAHIRHGQLISLCFAYSCGSLVFPHCI